METVGFSRSKLIALGAVLLLAACSPTMDEVVAEHRPAVEAVFARIQALEAAASGAPPVAADGFDTAGVPVVLDGEDSNALFLRADEVAGPGFASKDGYGGTYAYDLKTCGEALRGEARGVPEGVASFLATCGRAKYVFVLRTVRDDPPELVGDDSFRPGAYEGEVLLFRLSDGALLGGVRVSGRSSDQVMALTDASGNAQDVEGRLESDLVSKVFVDIGEKLKAQLPGVLR